MGFLSVLGTVKNFLNRAPNILRTLGSRWRVRVSEPTPVYTDLTFKSHAMALDIGPLAPKRVAGPALPASARRCPKAWSRHCG